MVGEQFDQRDHTSNFVLICIKEFFNLCNGGPGIFEISQGPLTHQKDCNNHQGHPQSYIIIRQAAPLSMRNIHTSGKP